MRVSMVNTRTFPSLEARATEEYERSSTNHFQTRRLHAVRTFVVVLATSVAAVVAPCRSLALEGPNKEHTLDIDEQALTPAIHDFSTQTGLNVGFFPQTPEEENTLVGPVKGTFTAEAALEELLSPEFEHEWLNDRSVYVFKRGTQPRGAEIEPKRNEASASKHVERRYPGGRREYDDVDFVIVLGARISGLESESQFVAAMGRREIDEYGVSTLSELFEYLPQLPFMRAEISRISGEQFADLRGFGFGTTMILINGRRVAGTATSFDYGGFDVNTIPLTAVQRVEVHLDAPSVAIGTDTLAGMINIVLKDQILSPTVEVRYGAADGGAEEGRVSASMGSQGDTFRGTATLELFRRNPLFGAEREPIRNQDYRRFGGSDYRSLQASPANIFALTTPNLPGLEAPFAAVPEGSSGSDLTPQDFAPTAGNLNRTSLGRFLSIVPEVSRLSLVTSAQLEFSPSTTMFGELFVVSKELEREEGPQTLNGAVVPASNAFNPFDSAVMVHGLLQGAPTRAWVTDGQFVRAVAGVRGTWDAWDVEFSAAWTEDRARVSRPSELNPILLSEALGSSDPNTALDVFRDGPAATESLLESLVVSPQVRRYSSSMAQAYARAERALLSLPGGDARLLFGVEWQEEELASSSFPSAHHRTVSGAFAELHVPLIDPEMHIPAVRNLAITFGARNDHYRGFGSVKAVQYGLAWRPYADLKLRAAFSESYRAPLLYELNAPRVSAQLALPDPRRGYQVSSYTATYAGNGNLVPTEGRTWTAGIDFTPRDLSHLHLSLGYWHTTLANWISPLSLLDVLANEQFFPGRVTRAAPSPQDIEAGMPGALQSIDISWGNFGRLTAAGIDFNVSLNLDSSLGLFMPSLSAVWNQRFDTSLARGIASANRIGIANDRGTIPRWRAVASIAWNQGPLSAFVAAQYLPAYADAFIDGTATGRAIPATTLFDTQISLEVGEIVPSESFLSQVRVSAGVKNMFDEEAHFSEIGWDYGFDTSQADLRQRFWYLRLEKEF